MFDPNQIKQSFKVFRENKDLVYLDSAATSLKPDIVVKSMTEYYEKYPFSINRGNYAMSVTPTKKYENTRKIIADFINVQVEEVVFTRSTTTSLNYLAHSLEHLFKKGDEIIVSNMEHHSNFLPWQVLAQKKELVFKIIDAKNKKIELDDVKKAITNKTKLIAIHHVSNVIGDVVDIKGICKVANEKNIITVIDGAQAAPHIKLNLKDINCSFYAFSGHKILGPTGIGVLYINKNIADEVEPFEYGGDMVIPSTVDKDTFEIKDKFRKFEAGTPSIAEVIGLGSAITYLNNLGMDNVHQHEIALKKYAMQKLEKMKDKVKVYNGEFENGIITFNIKDVAVHDAVSESFLNNVTFDNANIALRDGQHCNNLTMKYVLEEKSVLRASFYIYNTYEDIDKLVEQIEKIYNAWH